jgi:hypothetical protein
MKKKRGTLPTPHMTAVLVMAPEDFDDQLGYFEILPGPWQNQPLRQVKSAVRPRRAIHCTSCGKRGHNSRSRDCPERGARP